MFLDGDIGAPPTVTVFSFISAEAGAMLPRLIASATSAKPASAMVVMRFMTVTPFLCDVPDRGDFGATQPAQSRMRGHRDVSLPVAITHISHSSVSVFFRLCPILLIYLLISFRLHPA